MQSEWFWAGAIVLFGAITITLTIGNQIRKARRDGHFPEEKPMRPTHFYAKLKMP